MTGAIGQDAIAAAHQPRSVREESQDTHPTRPAGSPVRRVRTRDAANLTTSAKEDGWTAREEILRFNDELDPNASFDRRVPVLHAPHRRLQPPAGARGS